MIRDFDLCGGDGEAGVHAFQTFLFGELFGVLVPELSFLHGAGFGKELEGLVERGYLCCRKRDRRK